MPANASTIDQLRTRIESDQQDIAARMKEIAEKTKEIKELEARLRDDRKTLQELVAPLKQFQDLSESITAAIKDRANAKEDVSLVDGYEDQILAIEAEVDSKRKALEEEFTAAETAYSEIEVQRQKALITLHEREAEFARFDPKNLVNRLGSLTSAVRATDRIGVKFYLLKNAGLNDDEADFTKDLEDAWEKLQAAKDVMAELSKECAQKQRDMREIKVALDKANSGRDDLIIARIEQIEPSVPAVKIASLVPDPTDGDAGNETVTLRNLLDIEITLEGWAVVREDESKRFELHGKLAPEEVKQFTIDAGTPLLRNAGDAVFLLDRFGKRHDQVTYTADEAKEALKEGEAIAFA